MLFYVWRHISKQTSINRFKYHGHIHLKGQSCEIVFLWLFSSVDPIWPRVSFTKFPSDSASNSPSYWNSKFVLHYEPQRATNFFSLDIRVKT